MPTLSFCSCSYWATTPVESFLSLLFRRMLASGVLARWLWGLVLMASMAAPTHASPLRNSSADSHLPQANIIVFEVTKPIHSDE